MDISGREKCMRKFKSGQAGTRNGAGSLWSNFGLLREIWEHEDKKVDDKANMRNS